MPDHVSFMREAVRLAQDNRALGAHPFGAVLTQNGERVAVGVNEVKQNCDPTSHAEMQALRAAGAQLKQQRLDGCVVYASGSCDTGWRAHLACIALVAVLTERFAPAHDAKVRNAPTSP